MSAIESIVKFIRNSAILNTEEILMLATTDISTAL
jgi:hypothetical protein